MLVRPAVTPIAAAALAVVSSSPGARSKSSDSRSLAPCHQWCTTRSVGCQASSAEIKRDIFVFQNPHGHQDYAYKGWLGDGGFSSVSLSVHKRTGQPRAIKKICREGTNTEEFEAELRALIDLDHPHIVKVLEYFEDPSHFHVVLELCTGKDLFAHIIESVQSRKSSHDLERDASIIIRQCVKAVIGVHTKGFIHRDLKPENFLLAGKDLTVKLIDFGMASRWTEGQRTRGIVGTEAYMAPEMITGCAKGYDNSVDIWSLGVILFMMLALQALLPDGTEKKCLRDDVYIKKRIKYCEELHKFSDAARDLLERMLEWNPAKRITALEILEHPFVQARGCEQLPIGCVTGFWTGAWSFDRELPSKMERYARSPLLRQIGLRCLVHLAEAATLPEDLVNELLTARHIFRSLNPTGTGQVWEHQLKSRLEQERIPVQENFSEICKEVVRSSGPEATLDFDVLVACILIDAKWPDALLREVFNILDRSRDGVIEVEDLVELAGADANAYQAAFREVDPEGKGYINYDTFMRIMGVDEPLFQWFVPSRQEEVVLEE